MNELVDIGTRRIQTFNYKHKLIYSLTNIYGIKIGIQTRYHTLPDYSFYIIQDSSKLFVRNSGNDSNLAYQAYLKELIDQSGFSGEMLSEREKLEYLLNSYFPRLNSLTIPNSSSLSYENLNGIASMFILIKNRRLKDNTLKFSIDNLELGQNGQIKNEKHLEYSGNFRMPRLIYNFLEGEIITGKAAMEKFEKISRN